MPTNTTFTNLFGRSPFKPLQEHMLVVKECTREVPKIFEALCGGDTQKVKSIQTRISELESKADAIKNDLRAHLPKSLFMPVDRRDLLEVLDLQDSLADTAEDIAELLVERSMEVHGSMKQPLISMVSRCVDACVQSARIIARLDELVETGFRGPESDAVLAMVDELNKIESDTDQMGIELSRSLFAQEDTMKPISVVLWYELIKMIGSLADDAEKIGNRLRLLLAQ
ncbi:MAG: TIGR00153 family protein [Rhodospirillales bacterium]